jgi:transcriptional regulator with PAS, ATPase and Fis domain
MARGANSRVDERETQSGIRCASASEAARGERLPGLIGTSPAMAEVFGLLAAAAASPIRVLLTGETGTGKELAARQIHRASANGAGPFVAVNCAALPEHLLESQLFGHRRGAFTGAVDDSPGLFRAAAGGVIFLDEVGEMSMPMQVKLLRVLQEGEVVAVGDTRVHKVDARVLAATNRDLRTMVAAREFREDLYYRLAVFPIRLPALRERTEDIAALAASFLRAAGVRHGKRLTGFTPAALELLQRAPWPGNVRELENEIERAVALARDSAAIDVAHLSCHLEPGAFPDRTQSASADGSEFHSRPWQPQEQYHGGLREARGAFEAHYVSEALKRCKGNISKAAAVLSISRVALHRKVKQYRLNEG